MKKIFVFLTAVLVIFSASSVMAVVSPSPGSIKIPRDRQTTRSIIWNLSEPTVPFATQSFQGRFVAGNFGILGTVNTTLSTVLTVNPISGVSQGRVSEALIIPIGVIKRAEELGINQFTYERSFTGISPPETAVQIKVTTAAGGDLIITRMRLYFDNGRGEITVKRKEEGLKTYADIDYTGKGLFRGYWQVDNRVISYVNKHLVYGRKLTLETPDIPALPTFSEGTHTVKFIIQSPDQGIEMPKAIYYVRPLEAIEIISIAQIDPYNMAPVDFSPLTFSWNEEEQLATYLVEFMEVYNEKPVFSAYSKTAEYTMPPYVLNYFFRANKRYFWKIKGFDYQDQIAGESEVREFRFKAE